MQNRYNEEEINPTVIKVEIVIIFLLNFRNCYQNNRRNKSQINEFWGGKKFVPSDVARALSPDHLLESRERM